MNFSDIINDDKPVLVDFYADWCGPCKMMPPILKEVKSNLGDQVKIIKIDSDKEIQLSQKYQIRSIPTLMIFKNGKVLWKEAGIKQASELQTILKQYI
jgi:thioredoxin 1